MPIFVATIAVSTDGPISIDELADHLADTVVMNYDTEGEEPLVECVEIDWDTLREQATQPTVEITVEGGVVQNVEVPPGVTVIVKDYDSDDNPAAKRDADGDVYVEAVYEG